MAAAICRMRSLPEGWARIQRAEKMPYKIARTAQSSASVKPCCSSMTPPEVYGCRPTGVEQGGARLGSHEALERARYRDASHRVRLSVECAEYYRIGWRKATRRSCRAVQAAIPRCTPMLPMNRDPRPLSPVAMQASRSRMAFRHSFWLVVLVTALAVAVPLRAQEPAPRTGAPQAPEAVHTVRQIPEACTRLEGRYAQPGAARPYVLQAVAVGGNCQARARYVDGGQAQPSASAGWVLNDEFRIPEAACPGREAVVQVWRKA